MATHSSIPAWEIPWTEDSGGAILFMGPHRVGYYRGTKPPLPVPLGYTGGSVVKICACQAGEVGSIPGSGRSPGNLCLFVATHSSFLAWRIPETGEPGGLPSMGSHRVGHD